MEELNANKERPCRLSVFRFLLSGQDHIDMYVCTGGDTKTQSHYGDLPHQINRCQTPHPPLGELYPKKIVGGTNSNQLLYEFAKTSEEENV